MAKAKYFRRMAAFMALGVTEPDKRTWSELAPLVSEGEAKDRFTRQLAAIKGLAGPAVLRLVTGEAAPATVAVTAPAPRPVPAPPKRAASPRRVSRKTKTPATVPSKDAIRAALSAQRVAATNGVAA